MDKHHHQQFAERFVTGSNRVFRYILTLVPNRDDAEEIFQQTALTLWKRWEEYDPQRDFVRWACGIAHNHVRNFIRTAYQQRQGARVYLSEDVMQRVAETSLNAADTLEERRTALRHCLAKLQDSQREMIELAYAGEQKLNEIAEQHGMTPNALYKTLRRLRRSLYDCIRQSVTAGEPA
ncbi:MAG: sigma-70 family RNA polymerase sigma factor [Phycisphaera sp.]|nr:sigma-70 family RNA polymerase sigma factor [Phycisphaera sp.]